MTAGIDFDPAHRDAIAAKMNLSVLQRADPAVKRVLKLASHVCLYQLDDNHAWRRLDIEGSLFIVELHVNHPNNKAHARHRIVIINRKSLQNYSDDIVLGNKDIELNNQMIMYNNSKQHTIGIWFYQSDEASALFQLLQTLVNAQPSSQQPHSPPSQNPPLLQSSPSAASASRTLDQSPSRTKRAHKRVPRVSSINAQKARQHKSIPAPEPTASSNPQNFASSSQSVPDNSLERFFPGLKHTNGVAGGVLPPDVKTSSLLESAAVDALTSNIAPNKTTAAEFKPTAEIDEAIVIASDNAIPDAVLSTSPSASNHFPSQTVSILRPSKAEKKPRTDPRRKPSPKPKTNTPLKAQRPRKLNPAPKPKLPDSNVHQSHNSSAPYSQSHPTQSAPDHKFQSSPPSRTTSRDRRTDIVQDKQLPTSKRDIKKTMPADVNAAAQNSKPAVQRKSSKQLEVPHRSTAPQTVKPSTSPTSHPKAQSPPQPNAKQNGTKANQLSSGNRRVPNTGSTALPSASSSQAMEDLQRQLQSMPMPIDPLNMQDPLLRTMVPPFRFPPSAGDLPLAHTAAMMPSPIVPPPPPPPPFPPGMHPQMALLMQQHQLFLQQQFLAQQHQRHMQMQSMPVPTMPMAHKSELRNVESRPNGDAKSHSTKATDSAAELMRLLNVGTSDAAQQNQPSHTVLTDEEKGNRVAQSVAAAEQNGELATSSASKMDRSEFRAVVLRMLTDKKLFESVYACYASSKDE